MATSPMTRCVQTSLLAFPELVTRARRGEVAFVANEDLRETANYWCDRRRETEELTREFGDVVDFSRCPRATICGRGTRRSRVRRIGGRNIESRVICITWRNALDRFRVVGDAAGGERRREHALGALEVSVQLRTSGRGTRGARTDFRFGGVKDTSKGVPVVNYCGDAAFEAKMRADFDNCETRTCVVDLSPLVA